MIINAGINRIVVEQGYPDKLARDILDESGLEIEMIDDILERGEK